MLSRFGFMLKSEVISVPACEVTFIWKEFRISGESLMSSSAQWGQLNLLSINLSVRFNLGKFQANNKRRLLNLCSERRLFSTSVISIRKRLTGVKEATEFLFLDSHIHLPAISRMHVPFSLFLKYTSRFRSMSGRGSSHPTFLIGLVHKWTTSAWMIK